MHVPKDGQKWAKACLLNGFLVCFNLFAFPICSTLEVKSNKIGATIRILHEMPSLEPAPKVWNPESRSENLKYDFVVLTVLPIISPLAEGFGYFRLQNLSTIQSL